MIENYTQRIKDQYLCSYPDSTRLFEEIIKISNDIGLDGALAILENCVIEKRLNWLSSELNQSEIQGDSVLDGYHWFYEKYLQVSVPKDGEIVERTESRLVTRWWNFCPTLNACQKLGLDTRQICLITYHKPVDHFLKTINPKLSFERNYDCIRPYADYCEEIILLKN